MRRLRFDDIHLRELNGIIDANQHTFRWLLYDQNDESQDTSPASSITDVDPKLDFTAAEARRAILRYEEVLRLQKERRLQTRQSFHHCLHSENGVFYISGKPGSGKSILMKFTCLEDKTTDELKAWAGDKVLVFARFFFWAAGTEKQRSLEGLYRVILWEQYAHALKLGKKFSLTLGIPWIKGRWQTRRRRLPYGRASCCLQTPCHERGNPTDP
jgi:hypothetical protein